MKYIVRVQPQREPDRAGCVATFTDPDFVTGARDAVYYARAFEEPKPAINADNLRCERDADGNCVKIHPCPARRATPISASRPSSRARGRRRSTWTTRDRSRVGG